MTSLSIMLTVFVLQLHHAGPHQRTVPAWIRTLVIGYIARALCMRSHLGSYYGTSTPTASAETAETGTCAVGDSVRRRHDGHRGTSDESSSCRLFKFRRCSKAAAPQSVSSSSVMPVPMPVPSVRIEGGTASPADSDEADGSGKPKHSSQRGDRWSATSATLVTAGRPSADDDEEKSFRRAYREPRPSLVNGILSALGSTGRRRRRSSATNNHERVIARHLKLYLSRHRAEQDFEDVVNEWRLVAHIMDRLLFWLFLVGSVLSTVVILIVMPLLKPNLVDGQPS